jgi:hypothetical protein
MNSNNPGSEGDKTMTIAKKITNIKSLLAAIRVEIKERTKNPFSDRGESFLDDYTTRELRAKIEELTHRKNMLELISPSMRRVLNY